MLDRERRVALYSLPHELHFSTTYQTPPNGAASALRVLTRVFAKRRNPTFKRVKRPVDARAVSVG
jgi:hypothetical protein